MWDRWILMILRILRILRVVLIAFTRFIRNTLQDPKEIRLHLRHFRGDLPRTLTASKSKHFSSTPLDDAQRLPSKAARLREGVADDAQLRREWLGRDQEDKVENEHIDKLMMMVGLENAKAYFLDIYAAAHPARGQHEDLRNVVLDTIILGNPGTGKKTVARLYADFLMSLGLAPRAKTLRISGPQLRSKIRQQETLKEIQEMCSNDGGIVLLEGAQSIPDVRSVLGKLLGESAKGPSKVVTIVSSQGKETIDFTPVLNVNRQIPHVKLLDYTDEELRKILVDMIRRKFGEPIKDIEGGFDGPYLQTFVSIIGRGREGPNFGNVETLQACFSTLCDRRAKRLQREAQNLDLEGLDDFLFTKVDMLGEKAAEMASRSGAWKTLQSMIGLEKVKASASAMFSLAVVNYYRKLQGKKPIKITLNRCFLGPPGTGKTTVAKLYAQILVDLGLISKSKVVMKAASDLIGPYIGHSEMRTKSALDEARGGVLVIDDARMLLPGALHDTSHRTDVFRAAIIDTLVANIQPEPGEDRAVIIIGYTDGMRELFETSNPGLARRFPQEEAFHFTAFSDDQLGQILEFKLGRYELDAAPEAIKVAREMLSTARHRPNFGNGGDVENLISQATVRYQARVSSMDVSEGAGQLLAPGDFDPDFARAMEASERCVKLFSDMQGVEEIIAQFRGYQDIVANLKLRGRAPRPHIPLALVFKGPPGTGKTTVARKAAQIFYDMGILAAPELIECSVSDLVSEHAGLTGRKVIRMFERALGKVLFIDEAYRLREMRSVDAIGEIVDCMTKERFARKIVIILAGYEDDMNKLMRLNRGLRSRFATDVIFRPMRPAASLALLETLVRKLGIQLEGLTPANPSRGPILRILAQLAATKSWANGRDVEAFSQIVIEYAFKHRAAGTDPESRVIVRAYELLPLLESRLARAKQEDAEMVGDYIPYESTSSDLLHSDTGNSTRDVKHEETNIDVPSATASTSGMVLLDPSQSRDSRRAMTLAQIGSIDDLNRVVEVTNEVVEATPQDHPDQAGRLGSPGNTVSGRFRSAIMDTQQASSTILNGNRAAHFERCLLDSLFIDQFRQLIESSTWPSRCNASQRASLLEEIWNTCFEHIVRQLPLKARKQLGDRHSIDIRTQFESSTSLPIGQRTEDQDGKEIIFATLLPGGRTSKVKCRRHRDTLQNARSKGYQVLSYVRGDQSSVQDIKVDGKSLEIPKAVALLLKQLRQNEEEELLWFDEVCLEDSGLGLSGGLVDQVKAIYSNAKTVVVWLGDESDTSEMAYLFLEMLGNCSTPEQEALVYHCFTSPEAPPALNYLLQLLNRPWWDRACLLEPLLENYNVQVRFGNRTLSWEIFQRFFDILRSNETRITANTMKQGPQISHFLCQIPHRVGYSFKNASERGNSEALGIINALSSSISRIACRDPSEQSVKWTLAFFKVATNIGPMLDELALRLSGSYTRRRRFDFFDEKNDEAARKELALSLKDLGPPSWFALGPLPQSLAFRYGSRLSTDRVTELLGELKEFPQGRAWEGAEDKILELAALRGIDVPKGKSTTFVAEVIAELIDENGFLPSFILGEEGDRAKGWVLRFLEAKALALEKIRQILKEYDMGKFDKTGQTTPNLAGLFSKQEKKGDDDFRCWWSVLNAVSKTLGDPVRLADQLHATRDLGKQSTNEDVDINTEAPFTYEPLSPNEKAIRMLIVLPSSDEESQVQCELVKLDLEVMTALGITRYPFAALSYVWGTKASPQTVLLHGKEVTITPNLGTALRKFRDARLPVLLWVDALCINQTDTNEKSHQISLMGSIYHRAGHVLMWLGIETVGTGYAVLPLYLYDFLRSLRKYTANPNGLEKLERFLETTHTVEHLCSIQTMLGLKYWTRAWIVQEVLLAREATVCWGPYTVSWQSILDACGCNGHVEGVTHPHYMKHEKPLAGRLGMIYARRTSGSTMKISDALLLGRNRSATDPRDYVYAFLGLCDAADMIHPDYTKTLRFVFQDALEAIVKEERSLDILSYCPRYMTAEEFEERSKKWPSWLPHWSHKQAGNNIETKHSILAGRGRRLYNVSKETEAEISISGDKQILTAKGVFFDRVEVVSQQPWPISLEADWASYQKDFGARSPYGTTHSQQLALAHTTYLGQGTIDEAPLIAFKSDDALIAEAEKSVKITFGKTDEFGDDTSSLGDSDHKPTSNNDSEGPAPDHVVKKKAGEIFMEALDTFLKKAPCKDKANLLHISLHGISNILGKADLVDGTSLTSFSRRVQQAFDISFNTVQAMSEDKSNTRIQELSSDSHELSRRIRERPIHESRFFVTTRGYFGRGPIPVREGDWVCVLLGAKVPFILRHDENTGLYSLVGESYVHGIMNGKALEDSTSTVREISLT